MFFIVSLTFSHTFLTNIMLQSSIVRTISVDRRSRLFWPARSTECFTARRFDGKRRNLSATNAQCDEPVSNDFSAEASAVRILFARSDTASGAAGCLTRHGDWS